MKQVGNCKSTLYQRSELKACLRKHDSEASEEDFRNPLLMTAFIVLPKLNVTASPSHTTMRQTEYH